MIGIDPLSLVASILELSKFGSRLYRAEEEVKNFRKEVDETTERVKKVKEDVACYAQSFPPEIRRRFEADIRLTELTLQKASGLAKSYLNTTRSIRNLRWVLSDREAADEHQRTLFQRQLVLSYIDHQLDTLRLLSARLNQTLGPISVRGMDMDRQIEYLG
jgi:hypothetical protein